MIKLKDILFESTAPDIFIPRRTEDRLERMIKQYIRNGSKGNLSLSEMELTVLPDTLKNINVDGDFFCAGNKLTSLQNAPKSVGGSFYCSSNQLISLKGAPKTIDGSFHCSFNNLESLEGAPQSVGNDFKCTFNNLESLEGAPQSVGGNFICNSNPFIFSKRLVRAVSKVKGKIII